MPQASQLYKFSVTINNWLPWAPPKSVNEQLKTAFGGPTKVAFRWQVEKGAVAGTPHFQGCIHLKGGSKSKLRPSQVIDKLLSLKCIIESLRREDIQVGAVHDWNALWEYCHKKETRLEGCEPQSWPTEYKGKDIESLRTNPYPWQSVLYRKVQADADDRTIMWLCNESGNIGKTKWTKWMCLDKGAIKIPVGKAHQLRKIAASKMLRLGDGNFKRVWIIDIPRSIGKDDSVLDIISAIEEIKNGHVTSAMFGEDLDAIQSPSHIIVFSNFRPPWNAMSTDRWLPLFVDSQKFLWTGFDPTVPREEGEEEVANPPPLERLDAVAEEEEVKEELPAHRQHMRIIVPSSSDEESECDELEPMEDTIDITREGFSSDEGEPEEHVVWLDSDGEEYIPDSEEEEEPTKLSAFRLPPPKKARREESIDWSYTPPPRRHVYPGAPKKRVTWESDGGGAGAGAGAGAAGPGRSWLDSSDEENE